MGIEIEQVRAGARRLSSRAEAIVDDPRFERVVVGAILLNAAILGLIATPSVARVAGDTLQAIDQVILAFFTAEILLRLVAKGRAYFRSGWSWFDVFAVSVAYLPDAGGLAALRTLRVFRVLRLFSMVPAMRRVIESFFAALPSMAGVLGALAVIFYVSAIITTTVFGQVEAADFETPADPADIQMMRDLFGNLERSFFTLFQMMTLENWVDGVVAPTMRLFPNAFLFFGPYIVLTSFAILNLFIGVIVEAMQGKREEEIEAREEARDEAQSASIEEILEELRALRAELAASRAGGSDARR